MKKLFLWLGLTSIVNFAFGQDTIPNGSFERWTNGMYETPKGYPNSSNPEQFFWYRLPFNVVKTNDAFHGNYAVQVSSNASAKDTAVGYFLSVDPNSGGGAWTGGTPYNQVPKGIRGYYKYNVATTDSGTIIVGFSKAGQNIGTYMYSIGGIHNAYTNFDFTFIPALSDTPDSVFFGAVSCKLQNGQPHAVAGSVLKIDSVSFTGVNSQPSVFNGDFEEWETSSVNSLDDWISSNNGNALNGVYKTSDAYSGKYALELTTVKGDRNGTPVAQPGQISTGYYPRDCNGDCTQMGGTPFTRQTDTLAFYYKYLPHGNDTASINLNFKKNHVNIWGMGMNLHASENYQYKEIPFNVGQAPDSVIIQIQSSVWNDTSISFVGSDLKIDMLHFKSRPLAPKGVNIATVYNGLLQYAYALTDKGSSIVWYTDSVGGSVTTGPLGVHAGKYSAYAAAKNEASGFESAGRTLVTLTIFTKELTVVGAVAQNKVYDGSYDALIAGGTLTGVAETDDITLATASTGTFLNSDVEKGIEVIPEMTITGASKADYTLKQPYLTADITARPLTVTADDKEKTYGDENPELTVSYDGFAPDESTSVVSELPEVTTNAVKFSAVDTYAIIPSKGVASNYRLNYVNGKLSVSKAILNVSVADTSRKVGLKNPEFRLIFTGFKGSDNATVIDELPVATSIADALSSTGEYPVVLTGGSDNNYSFNPNDGTLTVTPSVNINTVSQKNIKVYPNPANDFVVIEKIPVNTVISVFNSLGTAVVNMISTGEKQRINLSNIPSGLYMIKLSGSNIDKVLRFIKE